MAEFLQSYGILLFIGLIFGMMLWGRVRGHGMGCCGMEHRHNHDDHKAKYEAGESCHRSGCH
jgi:hypothetical protein